MYGYYEYTDVTPEQLLQKIDQKKIFELVLKEPVIIGKKYRSPFREDKTAKCYFTEREDRTLLFVDFSDRKGHTHRSCFRMVMDSYEPAITLSEAINIICTHFNLSKNSSDYAPLTTTYDINKVTSSEETIITYKPRPFSKKDKIFWSSFLITVDDLMADNVFSVESFKIVNKKGVKINKPYGLCYAIDFLNHVKVYIPNAVSGGKSSWVTNCDNNDIGNYDNLSSKGDRLIITKSYKDHRVFRNVLGETNVVWFQNEGQFPDEDILITILRRFTCIVIFFDNDYTGFKQAYKLKKLLKTLSPNHNIRIRYFPVSSKYKDAGECVKKEGRKDFLKILKQIKL